MSEHKVLIIDDDLSFKKLVELRLRAHFPNLQLLHFDRISSARSELEKSSSTPEKQPFEFDLVILDQHLPDGEGLDLLQEGWFEGQAVLAVSSDSEPAIPGATLLAGATYFLNKLDISAALFIPLVRGIMDRNRLSKELQKAKVDAAVLTSVKTLVDTLRHEINNPLGVVLGAAYLLNNNPNATAEQKEAVGLVDASAKRIKHVMEQLSLAVSLQTVKKAELAVYHIPGDKPWNEGSQK